MSREILRRVISGVKGPVLNDTLFRVPRSRGLQLIQRRGERGARELTSWRLRLAPGEHERYSSGNEETVVVLQDGGGTFEVDGQRWTVSRTSVFDQRATALYLPAGRPLVVTADSPLEAILVSTPAPSGGEPALVSAADIEPLSRGKASYSRDVHNIFVTDGHVRRLMVGETFNPPGHWSSFPP